MEVLSKPAVSAIIEKVIDGVEYILVQNRCKEDFKKEEGLIEIPAGKIRAFECIYDTLRREVKEETGLDVIKIYGEEESKKITLNGYEVISYEPFSSSQNIYGEYPIMVQSFICKTKGQLLSETNESKNINWVPLTKLKELIQSNSHMFYPMHIETLNKYLKYKGLK